MADGIGGWQEEALLVEMLGRFPRGFNATGTLATLCDDQPMLGAGWSRRPITFRLPCAFIQNGSGQFLEEPGRV